MTPLQTWLNTGNAPQVVIFYGPRTTHPEAVVSSLIRHLICAHQAEEKCASCRYSPLQHPDVYVISRDHEDSLISLDSVKLGIAHLSRTPFLSQRVICVIPAAESLSIEAANALLKPLEDTKPRRHIFLLTHDIERIIPTLRSRATPVRLTEVSVPKAQQNNENRSTALIKNLESLACLLLEKSPQRFSLVESIHSQCADFSQPHILEILTEQSQKWQNMFLQEHRSQTDPVRRQELRALARCCERIPEYVRRHVSIKTILDNFIQYV